MGPTSLSAVLRAIHRACELKAVDDARAEAAGTPPQPLLRVLHRALQAWALACPQLERALTRPQQLTLGEQVPRAPTPHTNVAPCSAPARLPALTAGGARRCRHRPAEGGRLARRLPKGRQPSI
eukprot:2448108-Prymnesium_polylepis.1